MGALIAAFYACGKTIPEMEDIIRHLTTWKLLNLADISFFPWKGFIYDRHIRLFLEKHLKGKTFEKANNVLSNNPDKTILPLIVFDEIGLAEISKNNPLKVLHALLEPEEPKIAFVGISNWNLDASKMKNE